jgi:hypothetical protein
MPHGRPWPIAAAHRPGRLLAPHRIAEIHHPITGLLGHPWPVGLAVMPATCTRRVPCSMKNNTYKRRRKTVPAWKKSAARIDRAGLGGQERAPCLAAPIGCGADGSVIEDLPDGRWRERVAEAGECAVDAPVSPDRVVARHFQHQIAGSSLGSRASTTAVRVAPAALDDVGVPAQHRAWRDDQARLAAACGGSAGPARTGWRGRPRRILGVWRGAGARRSGGAGPESRCLWPALTVRAGPSSPAFAALPGRRNVGSRTVTVPEHELLAQPNAEPTARGPVL